MKIKFSKTKPQKDGYYLVLFSLTGRVEIVSAAKVKDGNSSYIADTLSRMRNIDNYQCLWSEEIIPFIE